MDAPFINCIISKLLENVAVLLQLLEWNESLGLFPNSENAETLGMVSSPKTQNSPESFLRMADPGKYLLCGTMLSLKGKRLTLKATLQNMASPSTKCLQ